MVKVPPLLNVNPFKINEVAATVNAVEPKLRVLKQLLVLNVATAVPLPVSVRLGALSEATVAVLPTAYVLVMAASAVKPPAPVQVKPVAVVMFNAVWPAVVFTNAMLPEPNAMARVVELLELNAPVVNVNPARANVPLPNDVVAVTDVLSAPARVVVPEELLRVNAAIVLPFGVTVPVPRMLAVNPVKVPPLLNVNPSKFNEVVPSVNAVEPKLTVSK